MTLRVWPSAVAFDSDSRTLPAPLLATLSSAAAPVILLVAGRRAIDAGWAPRAAVGLADGWCREGTRLVLADLGVGQASLDEVLGEASEEGLADVFLFGASLRRVIRSDPGRSFGFIPAGASPADSHTVLTDAGWRHVVAHFFREGATLLAYIPADAEGLDALALRLGAVIALVGPGDLEELEHRLPEDAAVLAVVEIPEAAVAPAQESFEPVASEDWQAGPVAVPSEEDAVSEPADTWAAHLEEARPAESEPVTAAGTAGRPEASDPWAVDLEEAEPAEGSEPVAAAEATAGPGEPLAAVGPDERISAAETTARPEERVSAVQATAEPGDRVLAMEAAAAAPAAEPSSAEAPASRAAEVGEPKAPDKGERPRGGMPESREDERPRGRPLESPRDDRVDALWARREEALARREKAPQIDVVPGRKPTEQERLREPFVLMRQPEPRRRWVVLLLWLAAGVVVGLAILFAILVYLGRTAEVTPLSSPGELTPRTDADAAGPAIADSLPYSVAIEAYPQYAPAVERAAQLEREQRGVAFFVTPTRDRGSVFYHVMAGPVADSVGAAALMQRLLDAGVKTGASQWDIVATRLAFFLGDFASRASAEERLATLADRGVPAYVVEVPLPGGPSRWRVYAGAFQGNADAAVLRPVLREAGVRDTLVPRIGIAPR